MYIFLCMSAFCVQQRISSTVLTAGLTAHQRSILWKVAAILLYHTALLLCSSSPRLSLRQPAPHGTAGLSTHSMSLAFTHTHRSCCWNIVCGPLTWEQKRNSVWCCQMYERVPHGQILYVLEMRRACLSSCEVLRVVSALMCDFFCHDDDDNNDNNNNTTLLQAVYSPAAVDNSLCPTVPLVWSQF